MKRLLKLCLLLAIAGNLYAAYNRLPVTKAPVAPSAVTQASRPVLNTTLPMPIPMTTAVGSTASSSLSPQKKDRLAILQASMVTMDKDSQAYKDAVAEMYQITSGATK